VENEKRLTCEDKIDAELEYELEKIQRALRADNLLRCDGCGQEWRSADEFEDCPVCEEGYAERLDEDENEYDLLEGPYIEHTVVRADISAGGPQDFWRLYLDPDGEIDKVSYHYFDWFDGAERWLRGSQLETVKEWFGEQVRYLMEGR